MRPQSRFLWMSLLLLLTMPAWCQPTPRRLPILPQKGPLAGQTVYTNSFALLVGINRYQNLPQEDWLEFARKDVLALRETLIRSYGFPPENIITLLDEQATRENIQSALAYLADKKRMLPTDRLLLYFSCHGQAIATPEGGKEGFLIPYDARIDLKDPSNRIPYYRFALPMRDLWAYVESAPAHHCLVMVDACFGGLLARPRGKPLGELTLQKLLSARAYQVLSAGGQEEEVWEDPALGHSVLMHSLLRELEHRAEEVDTTFTLTDLFASVRDVVIEKSGGKQQPQLQSYAGTEGDMVFVSTRARKVPPLVSGLPTTEEEHAAKPVHVQASELVTAGYARLEQKDYTEAERLCRQALDIDPNIANAHLCLGYICQEVKKDYDEAERQYRKAIELDPKAATAYNNLGRLYYDVKKDYAEAERLYKKAIEVDPKLADAYYNLGNLYHHKGDDAEAERQYRKAIEVDPEYSAAYNNLGSLYYVKKDYAEAERQYSKAIELDPKYALAHANLALSLYFQDKKDEALTEAKQAKELGLTDHPAFQLLGL